MANRLPVEASVLQWAADRSEHSQEMILDKFPNFPKWIAGGLDPTWNQIQEIAAFFRVPLGILFLSTPPPSERARAASGQRRRGPAVRHRQSVRHSAPSRRPDVRLRRGLPGLDLLVVPRHRRADRSADRPDGGAGWPCSRRCPIGAVAVAADEDLTTEEALGRAAMLLGL
jgi:hypothetical protein